MAEDPHCRRHSAEKNEACSDGRRSTMSRGFARCAIYGLRSASAAKPVIFFLNEIVGKKIAGHGTNVTG